MGGGSGDLTWWVPRDERKDGQLADRILRARWLPLMDIAGTRQFTVGHTMLDIGANIGTTAIPRVILGDFQRVYAAEPHPTNYACLVQNVLKNGLGGLVLPDQVAISNSNGEALMKGANRIGTPRLLPPTAPDDLPGLFPVPCLTLDAWVKSMGVDLDRVAFVKSDTQGWESFVLGGAAEVLEHEHIVWEIEFSPRLLTRADCDPEEFCAQLERHFTHFTDLRRQHDTIRPTSDLQATMADLGQPGQPRYTNLLLLSWPTV